MLPERLQIPDLETSDDADATREAAIVLVAGAILLLLFNYWGRPGFYVTSGLIDWMAETLGGPLTEHPGVGGYLWWGFSSLLFRVFLPLVVIVFILKRRPVEFGFRLRGIASHLPVYFAMYLVMLPVLIWVSSFDSFRTYYPFYDRAGEGGAAFWLYELGYVVQFIGVEAFFRGFLTFGLLRRFGLLSVVVMTVPYTMIHFGKPMPEATAAIVAGLVLGYLAVRSRSFVPGVMLHVSVALTMDLLVLGRSGLLANIF